MNRNDLRRLLPAATLVCLMAVLCGCASEPKSLPAPLAVDLSVLATCEKILAPVKFPPAVAGKTDANVAVLNGDAAIITANGRIAAGGKCVKDVREKYSGKPGE